MPVDYNPVTLIEMDMLQRHKAVGESSVVTPSVHLLRFLVPSGRCGLKASTGLIKTMHHRMCLMRSAHSNAAACRTVLLLPCWHGNQTPDTDAVTWVEQNQQEQPS
jgi:hypothetical protein